MMHQRFSEAVQPARHEPMYGWALTKTGRPTPIALAERGAQGYRCPICRRRMVAKKGDIKQHHFAHETESTPDCTPEAAARAIAGTWLVLALGERMALHQECPVEWVMHGQPQKADLLKDVTAIVERLEIEGVVADIALMQGKRVRCVVMLNLYEPSPFDGFQHFIAHSIPVVSLPADLFRSGQVTLKTLLNAAAIYGGWWLLDPPDRLTRLETDPATIQQVLGRTVSQPPYLFWGPLVNMDGREHVLRIGQHLLWLPPEIWQVAVGGTRNRLSNELVITTQEWPQRDGGVIALYYIMLRKNEHAVALRRFKPGEYVHANLNTYFRLRRATAEEIARLLVTT